MDAHDRQELGLRPAVERRRLAEDEGEDGEPGPEGDRRLQDLEPEVGPVLELVEGSDAEEEAEQAKGPQHVEPPSPRPRCSA